MANSTALLVSAYSSAVIAAMLAPLGLCIYVAAWFASRANIDPVPSGRPGVLALAVALAAMVLSAVWLHACDHYSCFSLPVWMHFAIQVAILTAVVISWRALSRTQNAWPSPSNNTVETDARKSGARGSP